MTKEKKNVEIEMVDLKDAKGNVVASTNNCFVAAIEDEGIRVSLVNLSPVDLIYITNALLTMIDDLGNEAEAEIKENEA